MVTAESFAALDVPRFVAVIVCSSGAADICTLNFRVREKGFSDGKGLAPGWGANVTTACVAPTPICFYSLPLCLSSAAGCNQSHGWNLARRLWLTLPLHFLCKLDL